MKKPLTILTGASRGMGLGIAEQLLEAGHHLLCISRKVNESLNALAKKANTQCEQWPQDLAQALETSERLQAWLAASDGQAFSSVTLINNAAALPPIAPMAALDLAATAQSLRVNIDAPLLLTAAFLRATSSWQVPRKVLNISSGLGRRAMAAQAPYCAAKAAMDHFTRCLALEESASTNGARVSSLAPGVIDTDMQTYLRNSNPAQFPDIQSFIGWKAQGMLSSPQEAARRVIAVLNHADFGKEPISDVRG